MKRRFLLSLLLTLASGLALTPETTTTEQLTAESLAGVWKGDFPDAPAVELTLRVQSGKAEGSVVFYRVVNESAGSKVKGRVEAPLIDPLFDGRTLSFKVKREDGTFFRGLVTFVAANEAILRSDDQPGSDSPPMTLRREE